MYISHVGTYSITAKCILKIFATQTLFVLDCIQPCPWEQDSRGHPNIAINRKTFLKLNDIITYSHILAIQYVLDVEAA